MVESNSNARPAPWLPQRWDDEADVVVVGYGGAGSCAAIAAHDAGQSTLILEKAPVGGGNTGCCGGGMRVPKDIGSAVAYYSALTQGTVDAACVRALAAAMFELPARLRAWGAELEWIARSLDYPGLPGAEAFGEVVSIARSPQEKKRQEGGPILAVRGDGLFAFLDAQVRKRRIRIAFDTPADRLVQDPLSKEILGVTALTRSGRTRHVKAKKAVILACGGFQNNREMLVNFLPYLSVLPTVPYGTPYSTGDGIAMAAEAGAKLWHMCGVELGQFAPRIPSEEFGLGFRLEKVLRPASPAIYVNKSARRFMDESVLLSHRKDLFRVQVFDQESARYPNIPFYMLFDDTYRKARPIVGGHMGWWWVHKVYRWSEDNSAEVDRGWITKADSIRGLAHKMELDPDALAASVEHFNAACASGQDAEFGRSAQSMAPLVTPPFYATELCEPIINTQGGPKRNVHAQVLDRADRPIARLYAAGELGSFFYPLYESASNVPEALAFGIVAAEHAARLGRWDSPAEGIAAPLAGRA
ncbi:MAG: FAD-binding protein [Burkholderiales bacterium]|nr:FAD-binding protein [Burkholderiales bacterium]